MDSKEILRFCLENKLLLDKDILELFKSVEDTDSVKLFLQNIKKKINQSIINKDVFKKYKEEINETFFALPDKNQCDFEKIKIGLGLVEKEEREEVFNKENSDIKVISPETPQNKKLEVRDFVDYFRSRFTEIRYILQENPTLKGLVSINKLSFQRENVSIIGIVCDKRITKNQNILIDVEDITGKLRVLVNETNGDLYKLAENIPLDSVLGFKGSSNNEIMFASEIVFPDSVILERKKSNEEGSVAFAGDLHFGSKSFLEKNFLRFIDYLNGKFPNTPEALKIKYLFLSGDVVEGIGNYPGQEKDIIYDNLEEQFVNLAKLLSKIRDDVKIIISPGNHDGIRIMEPQPFLDEKYAWPIYNLKNVIISTNPFNIIIGKNKDFSGFNVLVYHGFSYLYYADNIYELIRADAKNNPLEVMSYLLKYKHLAPTHGSTQYFPSEKDSLIINPVPDIFVSGHTHVSGFDYYNNILLVSISSWAEITEYQKRHGNKIDFCKVPIFNLKTREIKIMDFEK